jgi:hypothetical protein
VASAHDAAGDFRTFSSRSWISLLFRSRSLCMRWMYALSSPLRDGDASPPPPLDLGTWGPAGGVMPPAGLRPEVERYTLTLRAKA